MPTKTQFSAANHLICPQCLELLTRDDIEGFGRCPYCNHEFEFNPELEEFLLQPMIREWARHNRTHSDAGNHVPYI